VEKSQTRLFHGACKSRKDRAIRTFPQPRRRRVFGYISNVSTIDPEVTFLNGLTRRHQETSGCLLPQSPPQALKTVADPSELLDQQSEELHLGTEFRSLLRLLVLVKAIPFCSSRSQRKR